MPYQKITQTSIKAGLLLLTLAPALLAHPIVPGLEATELPADLKGRILMEELNCAACHQSDAPFAANSKVAPRLADIGSRVNPHYLETFISDPHGTKPGTTMPDMLASIDPEKKAEVAKSLTHFLLSLKKNDFTPQVPDLVAATQGQQLFHARGCVSCHSPRGEDGSETMPDTSAPLGDLGKKYSHKSLVKFLNNPHAVRPSGRMPKLNLPAKEVIDIAHYLLKDTKIPGHLNYTLHQGSIWEGIGTDGVRTIRAGHTKDFDLKSLGEIRRSFAIEFEGYLNITTPGEHTFYISLNGGSLSIDGQELFSQTPSQMRAPQEFVKTLNLKPGLKKVKFIYYHTGDYPALSFDMKGPDFDRAPVPSSKLSVSKETIPEYKPIEVNKALAAQGREHFTALGCASCHDDLGLEAPTNTPFSKLTSDKGCLSTPATIVKLDKHVPQYNLSEEQHQLITKSLNTTATKPLSNAETINKTLVTFNCTACHEREGVGAISPDRLDFFTGTHPELGDQGRIPPTLTSVGAKLQPQWIHKVLVKGQRQRDYMNVTMPQYGEDNIGHLAQLFGKVDSLEEAKFPEIESIKESKNAGYNMIGPKGFSCVACHDFNGKNSSGAGALDLVNATQSLQKNWFHLFMQNPSRFHETGIMPSFWPGGKSIRPDVLDGVPDQQIEALWTYLSDGPRAKKPEGLSRQSNQVRVFEKAEIVRGRGTAAGFRGIGVGYPQRLNLAFDSEEMALRILWKGTFADVDHGSFKASGKEQITFPAGIPFHRLKSLDTHWPYKGKTNYEFPHDHGYQFRGYRLDDLRRPTFQYHYGDITIDDFFEDVMTDNGTAKFVRTFSFNTPAAQEQFYFRAASGEKITKIDDNTYTIDKLTIRFKGDHKAIIRKGNPGDLLIPLTLPKGASKLTIEYQW
ncbi:MAG: c-type cytochrome [Akkermansiaceae bacterium]